MRKVILIGILVISLLFTSLIVYGGIAYSKDIEPKLTISEPNTPLTIKSNSVVIKGSYEPSDRKVWINGNKISAMNGVFETTYALKEGSNNIEVSAGDWKRANVNLVIIRELTDAEKAARITYTVIPTSSPSVESLKASLNQKIALLTPTTTALPTKAVTKTSPTSTSTPEPQPTRTVTIQGFPQQLEHYLNDVWDEMPGTSYKVYWWDTWEGVDSGNTHLVVEPNFEPTATQCQRIAQVATVFRTFNAGKADGVVHVVKNDNSGDYCSLRKP